MKTKTAFFKINQLLPGLLIIMALTPCTLPATQSSHPLHLLPTQSKGNLIEVAVSGHYAYCLRQKGELEILDISDPTHPKRTGHYRTAANHPRQIAVDGGYTYISDGSGLIHLLDTSDPRSPKQIAYLKGSWGYNGIAVSQDRLYVAGAHRFYTVDISSPHSPRRSAFHTLKHNDIGIAVTITNNHAFMTAEYWKGSQSHTRLYVFKLSQHGTHRNSANNPDSIQLLTTLDMDVDTRKMTPKGNYIFLAGMKDGLITLDVSNPAAPKIINRFPVDANLLDVFVSDRYAYLACDRHGLKIVDVYNPNHPQTIAHFNPGGYGSGIRSESDTTLLVDGRKGLILIDTTSPHNPRLLSVYPH